MEQAQAWQKKDPPNNFSEDEEENNPVDPAEDPKDADSRQEEVDPSDGTYAWTNQHTLPNIPSSKHGNQATEI